MRVLIAGFDLYRDVGGGQTFYRGIIARNPAVRFWYLRRHEPADAPRPPNAVGLDYRDADADPTLAGFAEPEVPAWAARECLRADAIGRAAAGLAFDAIDTPDYERHGPFLPIALRRHGGSAEKVVLSMHGGVSVTAGLDWGGTGEPPADLTQAEALQYAAADARYFLSPQYRDEWRAKSPLPTHDLDPMSVLNRHPSPSRRPRTGPPPLLFVGRTEKCKGPHLFVQTAWWLPPDSYSEAVLIGPSVPAGGGLTSTDRLREMIAARQLGDRVRVEPPVSAAALAERYAAGAVVVAPSTYDTLNLVALEAVFAGCPTVVSRAAGACRYLRERFPGLPFVEIDLRRFYAELPKVERVLREFDRHRDELAAALQRADFAPRTPPVTAVYAGATAHDPTARAEAERYSRAVAAWLERN